MSMQVGQAASSAQADVQQAGLPGQGCRPHQQGIQRTPARQRRSVPARRVTGRETGKQLREGRQRLIAPLTIVHSTHATKRDSSACFPAAPGVCLTACGTAQREQRDCSASGSGHHLHCSRQGTTAVHEEALRGASALAVWAWGGVKQLLPLF